MITHWSKVYALKKSDGRSVATHNEKNTPFDFFFKNALGPAQLNPL